MLNAARTGGVFRRNVAKMKIGGGQFKDLGDVRGDFRYSLPPDTCRGLPVKLGDQRVSFHFSLTWPPRRRWPLFS
ncbi:hypothetical protein AB7M49_003919 [Bradyrhizobium elkanii]|uniref:Uncharacterized protein n=1 Tax=Bradyrhizobium elkanii TaxID=29448 RepID=A0A8I1XXP4_BRAEL|nr:hypothetical protein [Bradyrhizobium elkanii]MCS4007384.1 hypothetical protein [Bradyrhizobium elkanii USDA 61]MBP2428944.1 hypothetical protein [Bradyrhizobium elkanii]MCP1929291.1 hypothetical protein [Bradyrhizobium elkanii]MCP1972155.1 hypothetical protein [Bradyrhizobium elkanii]